MRQRHRRFPFRLTLGAAAAAGLVLSAAAPAQATGEIVNAHAPGAIPDHYIVVLRDAPALTSEAGVQSSARGLVDRYGGSLGYVYSAALRGFSVRMPEAQARVLAADPAVKYVQQSAMARIAGTQQNPPSWASIASTRLICRATTGGFNWSSQHLDRQGEVLWRKEKRVKRFVLVVHRCVRRDDHRSTGGRSSAFSGNGSPKDCPARTPLSRAACRCHWGHGGSAKLAVCRRSALIRRRAGTSRSPNARRSRS